MKTSTYDDDEDGEIWFNFLSRHKSTYWGIEWDGIRRKTQQPDCQYI